MGKIKTDRRSFDFCGLFLFLTTLLADRVLVGLAAARATKVVCGNLTF